MSSSSTESARLGPGLLAKLPSVDRVLTSPAPVSYTHLTLPTNREV